MLGFLKRICVAVEVRSLRRHEPSDGTPRTMVRLCHLLEAHGRYREAVQAARRGLERFPHAHELQDVLRRGYERCEVESAERPRGAKGRGPLSELADVVRAYLDFARLDEAARAARALMARHPDDAEAMLLHGRVLQALFERDHVARDGQDALTSLQRAVALDGESLEARRTLAAAYHAIGATSQAVFHVLLALEMAPFDEESNRLYSRLRSLPFQRRAEKDLLWEAEINDQPLVEKKTRPKDGSYGDLVRRGVSSLSGMAGVRRVAMRHRGVAIVSCGGGEARPGNTESDAFLASAEYLRRSSSAWAKRIGMGCFEEATLCLGETNVVAVAAGGSVLALEVSDGHDLDGLADEARNMLAGWTASNYRDMEWVR